MKLSRLFKGGLKHLFLIVAAVCTVTASAQTVKVSGRVATQDGTPAAGATVIEKENPSNGVATDPDGMFSINVAPGAEMVVSFLGYSPVTVRAIPERFMTVILEEDALMLSEVVVTGYTTQRKADLTGAVSVVSTAEIAKTSDMNVMQALQGRVAGMTVTTSGDPSGDVTVRMRGQTTMNNNDPLYIVDGIATKDGIKEIGANDIETFQVLKDAASASIYGSRAANGVVIITTKKGTPGKMKVNFNASTSLQYYANRLEMMDADQYGEALYRAYTYSGLDPNTNAQGYKFDAGGNIIRQEWLDADKTMKPANTDWFEAISRTGVRQNYSLDISNANERGRYFMSLNYLDDKGIMKYSGNKRISTRLNSSFNLFKDVVTVGENLTLSYGDYVQNNELNLAMQALPIVPVYTEDGGWGGPVSGMNDRDNPLRKLYDKRDDHAITWRTFGNVYVDIKPVRGLTLRSTFGIDYQNYHKRALERPYKNGFIESDKSAATINQRHTMNWTWTNTAVYNLDAGKHHLNFLLGHEMVARNYTTFTLIANTFDIHTKDFMWPDAATGASQTSGNAVYHRLQSFFGKVDYNYDDRYLLSVTVRRDGSSRFGANNRYGTFPAVSAGWRISQEGFMQDVLWLSDLKLRASWGQNGNQELSDNSQNTLYDIYYSSTADPTFGTRPMTSYDIEGKGSGILPSGYRKTNTGNPDLKWETTTQTNAGVDFAFLDNRLYGSFDWYFKHTTDILVRPQVIAALGEGARYYYNGATLDNTGFEIVLGWRDKTKWGLTYDIVASLDHYRNEVKELPVLLYSSYAGNGTTDNVIGRSINSYYGYIADGIYKTDAELNDGITTNGKALGRIRWRDLDDSGTITTADRTWIGDGDPAFSYGLNVTLGYKGFDFTMFWQGVHDQLRYNTMKESYHFWAVSETGSNKGVALLDGWSPQNPSSDVPAISLTDTNNERRASSYFYENCGYLKLRTLQLGYTLPRELTSRIRLDKVRVYCTGQNLATITAKDFTGVDPEMPNFGYPFPTSVSFGLQLTF